MTVRRQSIESRLLHRFISTAILLPLLPAASISAQPAAAPAFTNTLMPLPATIVAKPGALRIDPSFSYTLKGDNGSRLSQAAVRFIARLEIRTGISLAKSPAPAPQQATLTIDVATPSEEAVPQPGEDESYSLD